MNNLHNMPNYMQIVYNGANYYNTTNLTGNELKKAIAKNKSQNLLILNLLTENPTETFTKHDIWQRLTGKGLISIKTPESSISRALSDLAKAYKVVKHKAMRMGGFGKPNHTWGIAGGNGSNNKQISLFEW